MRWPRGKATAACERASARPEGNMIDWFAATLRSYPEIAIFLALGIGYYAGRFTFRGIGLGAVTSTLLAAVLIGQLGITISPNVKSVFFLMFLFAVGYGVGPQFVRGIAKDGLPQALFAAVVCVFCLGACLLATKLVGYDLGYAAGLYAGSQTISASMGLATDAINRLGLAADQAKGLLDAMPVAYAVTYIFGTVGSAILLALLGPRLLGIDLVAACKAYEERQGGGQAQGGAGSAWHRWELRAFRVQPSGKVVGLRAVEAEALLPDARVFVLRLRRNGRIEDATADTVLRVDDVIAVAGAREVLVRVIGDGAKEIEDPELLSVPVEGIDVYVTSKAVDGKTLAELAQRPTARGVFVRIPSSTVWFMNSVGLNVFIAVVGISAGPGFVKGLQTQGVSLFLWGMVATSLPLVLAMFTGKYVFRFDPAIVLGACAGARTTTAALGMVCEQARSQVPALGYTVTYAVGNTLLTIWGMVIIILLS